MVDKGLDANCASLAVGYESLYQCNSKYKRLFGQPLLWNANRWRT